MSKENRDYLAEFLAENGIDPDDPTNLIPNLNPDRQRRVKKLRENRQRSRVRRRNYLKTW